jgi:hypothetical protein
MGWLVAFWIVTVAAAFSFGAWSQKKWNWLGRT